MRGKVFPPVGVEYPRAPMTAIPQPEMLQMKLARSLPFTATQEIISTDGWMY
jgi:hypothetical protein